MYNYIHIYHSNTCNINNKYFTDIIHAELLGVFLNQTQIFFFIDKSNCWLLIVLVVLRALHADTMDYTSYIQIYNISLHQLSLLFNTKNHNLVEVSCKRGGGGG